MADDKEERVSSPVAPETATDSTAIKDDASKDQAEKSTEGADAPTEDAAPTESGDKDSGDVNADEAKANGDATPTRPTSDANGSASASNKKSNGKRKSSGAVPEHKNKKLNKKKSMPNMHLDVEAGDYWFCTMKGYPPWPAIVVEDDMLPATLLENRPVSAKQANGEYRADFEEGGKNAKDRRYPVMFLGTNEFAWHVNTELSPLDMSEIKELVGKDDRGKKGKAIWEAYKVAAKEHDLDYFRQMLLDHQDQLRQLEEEQDAKDAEKARKDAEKAEKAAKAEKTPSKKSKSKPKEAAANEDVDMEDAEDGAVKAPKSASKKRKKEVTEGDDEPEKPAKTPKTIKLTGLKDKEKAEEPSAKKAKTPKSTTKKTPKPKEKATKESGEDADLTEDQKKEKSMGKMVLYLRHKLQKGFLARDQKPKEEEMEAMDQQFKQLEGLTDLDAATIRNTKINKVLKAILKLQEIPKEAELKFKERSSAMLSKWAPMLGIDDSLKTDDAAATNGAKHDDEEPATDAKSGDEKMEDVKSTGDDEKKETEGEAEKENADASTEAPKAEVSAEA